MLGGQKRRETERKCVREGKDAVRQKKREEVGGRGWERGREGERGGREGRRERGRERGERESERMTCSGEGT